MADGATAEMCLVGNEGVMGIALLMDGNTVAHGGAGSPVLHEEFKRGGPCQLLLLRCRAGSGILQVLQDRQNGT